MACYGREEFKVCSGRGLLRCEVCRGRLVLYEGVKDFFGNDGVVVIQTGFSCVLILNVKSFNCVQMCPFSLVM